ncbi:glycosyltransferase [Flavobacterium crassostreae]|uniref:Glycosyl transferase n=1 Tax=Flavobacterium crassostreae TaxID=1763534 RepID=A0A1B9E3R3_9FLAO|nr:glycosyltransferase [Flavobacterium crassostreae]OCB76538.1 glycosyl transferase [Flavobacterium crassostreae]
MQFLIITSVPHIKEAHQYFAYAPYVQEMNLWAKQVDQIQILAPLSSKKRSAIDTNYQHHCIKIQPVYSFDVTTIKSAIRAFFCIPINCLRLFRAMQKADHIHLRCPGNIGLLGCIMQLFFPNTPKTAKYAANWDPKAKQPWTYMLQQKILQNTFWTKNMQVLIYGAWDGQTNNCKSFFTASYFENEKEDLKIKDLRSKVGFVFVGALTKGKNPLYAIQLVAEMFYKGFDVSLDLYGEGIERSNLENYILENKLEPIITLKGNQNKATLKKAYQQSHFTLLPSQSEGWPKAIAEAMFWGSVPVVTAVSCVTDMLDNEKRGELLAMDWNLDILKLTAVLQNNMAYKIKQKKAFDWSQQYTLDFFEAEIKKILF